jgi:signal transduction histidine kinase
LLNILSNALKFSNGEVQLIISTSNGQLSIKVKDRGIGIPEDEMEQIFQPFYRASNAKHISGTGLGLAIVNAMVDSLGGKIQVSRSMEEGTTIQIMIPYETNNQDSCH